MDKFSKAHPVLHLVFFVCLFVLVFSVSNPAFSTACLVCAFLYNLKLKGTKGFKSLGFVLTIIGIVSIFNMLFAHYGEDVLFAINETEFTLEALLYGLNQGILLSGVVLWFDIFGRSVDSEKIIYLFRFTPKIALLFSMVLGFIPRFSKKLTEINEAKRGLNNSLPQTKKQKLGVALSNLSALISYALEGSIVTADSMNARGYNPRAVRPSRYKFKALDGFLIVSVLLLFSYVIYSKASGKMVFIFEPKIYFESFDLYALLSFCFLGFLPLIVDFVEEVLWKLSASKM